jgi:hypothetical protein
MVRDDEPMNVNWADRLDEMAEELDRVERHNTADTTSVRTYEERTVVTLTYQHEEDGGEE